MLPSWPHVLQDERVGQRLRDGRCHRISRPATSAKPDVVRRSAPGAPGSAPTGSCFSSARWAADFRMVYLNSDGSRADLCGNATLCSVRLAVELGIMPVGECHVETDAGVLSARLLPNGPGDRPQARRRREDAAAISAGSRRAVDRLRAGRRAAPGRAGGRRGDGRRRGPRAAAAARPLPGAGRERQLRVPGRLQAAGGCGPTSAASRGRRWRAGPAPSPPPCCSRERARPDEESGTGRRGPVGSSGASQQRTLSGWHPSLAGEARLVFQGVLGEV